MMSEQTKKVTCPLCEGQGELMPAQIVETFLTPELRKRLDARITEIAEISGLAPVVAGGKVLDFQKEVHTWNPALPIWRRSPKE
jgi:DNA gyrase/topoisomerase IV subunit B